MEFNGSVLLTCRILHSSAELARREMFSGTSRFKTSTYPPMIWKEPRVELLWPPSCYLSHFDARIRPTRSGHVS